MEHARPRLVATNELQEPELPSFGEWLRHGVRGVKYVPGVTLLPSVGTAVYEVVFHSDYLTDPQLLLPVTSGAQCLFILLFVFLSRFTPVRGFSAGKPDAEGVWRQTPEGSAGCAHLAPENLGRLKGVALRALRHYRNYWMILWLCWLLLYAVLTFMHLVVDPKLSVALKVGATFLNNSAALALLYCYLTLSRPESLGVQSEKGEGQADWFVWVGTLFMLTILEATLVMLAMAGHLPARFTPEEITGIFGWISGIGTTVVMFFYTRRLASRFMECPTWVIVLLCVYAGLQPGFGVVGKANPWQTFMLLNFALVLKTLLFLYMTWVFKYGWLLYYFTQVARFRDPASSEMKVFSKFLD